MNIIIYASIDISNDGIVEVNDTHLHIQSEGLAP